MQDVTLILNALKANDPKSAQELMPVLYEELRKLAAWKLAQEKPGQTLQATALVHEAYLRLVENVEKKGVKTSSNWKSRGHFFAAAAEAMRCILVETARRKKRLKRGGDLQRVDLDDLAITIEDPIEDILALDEALSKLAEKHPEKAEIVKLRYFAGLTMKEAAEMLGISTATAERYWAYARAWLFREIAPEEESGAKR